MKASLVLAYIVHAYVSLIGIALSPIYVKYLGAEGFGLVGFYVMAQGWMVIFDMGLTPILSREMSRFRAGVLNAGEAAIRLRTLEVVQGVSAVIVAAVLWGGSGWIGQHWLSSATLSPARLANCISLIGFAVVLRWVAGLQRATLVGLEQQAWVNGITVIVATLRFGMVLLLLRYVSVAPEDFFLFQLGVGVVELVALASIVRLFLPCGLAIRPQRQILAEMVPMAGSMTFLTVVWVFLTQIDKLILSGMLTLRDYGYFTFAVMAASGVLVLVAPLNQVLQPRLTILAEGQDGKGLLELYRLASQFVVVGFLAIGGGLAFFSKPLLLLWSNSFELAGATAPILFWYALANAIVGILVLPFMLQFARGKLKLHVIGNVLLLAFMVPSLMFAAKYWGAKGAGQVFFVSNLLFLCFWVPLIHRYMIPALTWRWSMRDVFPLALVMLVVFFAGSYLMPNNMPNLEILAWVGGVMTAAVGSGIAIGDRSRSATLVWACRLKA